MTQVLAPGESAPTAGESPDPADRIRRPWATWILGAAVIVVLAPWLLVCGLILTLAVALLGRAVVHHDNVIAAGTDVTALTVIAALVLLRMAWRSPQP